MAMSNTQPPQGDELALVSDEVRRDAEIDSDEEFRSDSRERLPFAFSHRFDVVIDTGVDAALTLYHTAATPLAALLEVRRYTGR